MFISLTSQAVRGLVMILLLVVAVFVRPAGLDPLTALLFAVVATGLIADGPRRVVTTRDAR